MNRREAITLLGAAVTVSISKSTAQARQNDPFQKLLLEIEDSPELMRQAREFAEHDMHDYIYFDASIGMAIEPQKNKLRARSFRQIGKKAMDLIIFSEVTSYEVYEARYQKPIWPGGDSGITIAIGYDLGATSPAAFADDWRDFIAESDSSLLSTVIGLKGDRAKASLGGLNQVSIDYDTAEQQFRTRALPVYIAEAEHAYKNSDRLSANSFGALVSLTYNRGSSSVVRGADPDDRRREIRAIKDHMRSRAFNLVPAEIRSMKRLWEGKKEAAGLLLRREAEALLFEQGLQS